MLAVGQKVILKDDYTVRTIESIHNKIVYFKEVTDFCHESDCRAATAHEINNFDINETNKQIERNKLQQKIAHMRTLELFRHYFG